MSLAISIMAKAPEPGKVKTRLCPPLLPAQAAELAAAFVLDTAQAAQSVDDAETLLVYAGDRTRFPSELHDLSSFLQRGTDLGMRIEHAARLGLANHTSVLVLGSDIPGVPPAYLHEARSALNTHDVVLGPSMDGGFYLIGMHACPPGLLTGLAWSVPETYAVCAARIERRGLRLARISGYDDIDDIDDLRRLKQALDAGTRHAPATAAALERLQCV